MTSNTWRRIGLGLILLLLGEAFVGPLPQVVAFSVNVVKPPLSASTTASQYVYEGLSSTPLVRASDSSSVFLPTLWRSGTPFGVGDEVAVCAFLRHYG